MGCKAFGFIVTAVTNFLSVTKQESPFMSFRESTLKASDNLFTQSNNNANTRKHSETFRVDVMSRGDVAFHNKRFGTARRPCNLNKSREVWRHVRKNVLTLSALSSQASFNRCLLTRH